MTAPREPVLSTVVRYSDCDMQHVVHNSVHLRWADDAVDVWSRAVRGEPLGTPVHESWWDLMVKRAELTWSGASRLGDRVDLDVEVSRWGNTSFDATVTGRCGGDARFVAVITYVAVRMGTLETVSVPDEFRAAVAAHAAR